jgi:PKHD-type hydroxylase
MIYQIPPRQPSGKDFSAYWDNFLSRDEINELLSMPEWLNSSAGSVGGQQVNLEGASITEEIRSSSVSWLNLDNRTSKYWDKFSKVIAEVNSDFFQFDLSGMYEPMQLTVYKGLPDQKDHYTWHTDMSMRDRHVPRKLSMTLLLSDPSEFTGGELEIKTDSDNIITLEQKQGRAWFFPSWVLHRVAPVTSGIRRSLVIWVGGPPFK